MYKINFIKKLDKDTSGIETEGEVTFAKEPTHFKSKPEDEKAGKRAYDFWTQWIFLKDDTESIGVSVSIGKEEDKVKQGEKIIVRGKIDEWTDRDGALQKKIMGKVIKPQEEPKLSQGNKEIIKKDLKEAKKGQIEPVDFEMDEKDIRKESAIIAFNYGGINDISIHDCFDLAKIIGVYIKSGEVDIGKMVTKEKPVEPKETEPKTEKETKEKSEKIAKDLEKLFYKGQEIGLATWVEIIKFAAEKEIFPIGTTIEFARPKLLANYENCYDKLLEFIEIRASVDELPKDEQPTSEIPF